MMTIGELAARAGVAAPTVRYYEERGLLRPPRRSASGYRLYEDAAAGRLIFIRHAQTLGFTLDEIGEFLALRVTDPASCVPVAAIARDKIQGIRRRVAELQEVEHVLEKLVESCDAHQPTEERPMLAALTREAIT